MISQARTPVRSLATILFAALLALSLIASTIDSLAAVRSTGMDRGRHTETGEPRELPGRGITWE